MPGLQACIGVTLAAHSYALLIIYINLEIRTPWLIRTLEISSVYMSQPDENVLASRVTRHAIFGFIVHSERMAAKAVNSTKSWLLSVQEMYDDGQLVGDALACTNAHAHIGLKYMWR